MMKKVWLVLLAVVLVFGLALVGCGSKSSGSTDPDDPDENLVTTTVFDLTESEGIQALTPGVINNSLFAGSGNPITPLVRAGEDKHIDIEIVKVDGKNSIKYTTKDSWGVGIDLNFSAFGFKAGDVVTVTGEVLAGSGTMQLNSKVGGAAVVIGNTDTDGGAFTLTATLTATDVTNIKSGTPAALRIEARATGMTVRIDSITIVGKRPSTDTPLPELAAPVVTLTATGVSWIAIEGAGGYKVYEGENLIGTEGPTSTSFNLFTLTSLADGSYSVTVIALGVTGTSKDSPASTAVTYVKFTPPPPEFTIKVAGTDVDDIQLWSIKGSVDVLNDNTGFTFTYPESGSNVNYGNSYAFFKVDLGSDKLGDYKEVKFTFKGETGDLGYKAIHLIPLTDKPTAAAESSNAIVSIDTGYDGKTAKNFTFALKDSDFDDESELYYVIILWANNTGDGAATSYTISNIEFVKGVRPVPKVFPQFSNASGPLLSDAIKWEFGTGAGNKHGTLSDIYNARYLVIASYAPTGTNTNGYGGMQPTCQGDGNGANSWAGGSNIKKTGDWTSLSHAEGDLVYFVFDLSKFTHLAELQADTKPVTQVQFYFNNGGGQLGECAAYLTTADLSAVPATDATEFKDGSGSNAGDDIGYVSKNKPTALTVKP